MSFRTIWNLRAASRLCDFPQMSMRLCCVNEIVLCQYTFNLFHSLDTIKENKKLIQYLYDSAESPENKSTVKNIQKLLINR